MSTETVAIVGAGAIGTALAHALSTASVPVVAVASRRREHAEALATAIPGAEPVSVREAGRAAAIVLLTVSDSAIEDACAALDAPPGVLVAHTSGSRDVTALEAATTAGADVGGIHPLAAVARRARGSDPSTPARADAFRGALFAIEGSEGVTARLSALAAGVGGHPFPIAAQDKPLYHLGASMLAASAAGLSQISWDELRRAGADATTASRGVSHLLRTVADNIERAALPGAALTGPVARGDAEGLRRQAVAARALSTETCALYRAHALHNIEVARGAGLITGETADGLLAALLDDETTRRRKGNP
jgi:predicted short-subunit dehydrogenase-like oxidoreductase (DUF2520 family)